MKQVFSVDTFQVSTESSYTVPLTNRNVVEIDSCYISGFHRVKLHYSFNNQNLVEIDRLYLWTLGCFVKGMQTNVLANSVHGVFQYQRNLEVDKSSQKGLQKTGRSYITSIKNKFPNWINRNLVVGKTFMKRALDNEECAAKSFELTSIVFYFHVTVFPACNSNANEYCESIIMLWESIASLFTQRRVIFIITVQPSLIATLIIWSPLLLRRLSLSQEHQDSVMLDHCFFNFIGSQLVTV